MLLRFFLLMGVVAMAGCADADCIEIQPWYQAKRVVRVELGTGAMALRYEPRRSSRDLTGRSGRRRQPARSARRSRR